jgi:hypothetical protein
LKSTRFRAPVQRFGSLAHSERALPFAPYIAIAAWIEDAVALDPTRIIDAMLNEPVIGTTEVNIGVLPKIQARER